jgi:hypothetical protein
MGFNPLFRSASEGSLLRNGLLQGLFQPSLKGLLLLCSTSLCLSQVPLQPLYFLYCTGLSISSLGSLATLSRNAPLCMCSFSACEPQLPAERDPLFTFLTHLEPGPDLRQQPRLYSAPSHWWRAGYRTAINQIFSLLLGRCIKECTPALVVVGTEGGGGGGWYFFQPQKKKFGRAN